MAIVVTDGKTADYEEWEKGCNIKNVYRGNEAASMGGGFATFDKGTSMTTYYGWDAMMHIVEGSMRLEADGTAQTVKPGDFINVVKDTDVTFHADEDVKLWFVTFPKYE